MGRKHMSYERESIDFQPVTITVDGAAVTTGVQVALTPNGTRPTVWDNPVTVAGKIGVMVQGLTPGLYTIWAKVTSAPETPVLNCGYVNVT
jgi:hypothetical protein